MIKEADALLTLLNDPDEATFEAIVDSLTLDAEIIPVLEKLWHKADDQLALSRLNWLIRRARTNKLSNELAQWQKKEGRILEGAWLVATLHYPDLTFDEIDKAVEKIVMDVWLELSDDSTPQEQIEMINSVLFGKYGIKSDKSCTTSLDNMLINNVLIKKKANHLAMLILYLAVAERLNIPLYPVMLFRALRLAYVDDNATEDDKRIMFYVEPFEKGLIFDHETANRTLAKQGAAFDRKLIMIFNNALLIQGFMLEMIMLYKVNEMNDLADDIVEMLMKLKE